MAQPAAYVGIDVSQDRLDVSVGGTGEVWPVGNDAVGRALLRERLVALAPAKVADEGEDNEAALVSDSAAKVKPTSSDTRLTPSIAVISAMSLPGLRSRPSAPVCHVSKAVVAFFTAATRSTSFAS